MCLYTYHLNDYVFSLQNLLTTDLLDSNREQTLKGLRLNTGSLYESSLVDTAAQGELGNFKKYLVYVTSECVSVCVSVCVCVCVCETGIRLCQTYSGSSCVVVKVRGKVIGMDDSRVSQKCCQVQHRCHPVKHHHLGDRE